MLDDPVFTSEVARMLTIANETVRAWERRGILKARRTTSGVRVFSRAEVEQLRRSLDEQRRTEEPAPAA